MIELYLALGMLGLIYYSKNNDSNNEQFNNKKQKKNIEHYKDSTEKIPKKILEKIPKKIPDMFTYDNTNKLYKSQPPIVQEPFITDTSQRLHRDFFVNKFKPADNSKFPKYPKEREYKYKRGPFNNFWKSDKNGNISINKDHYLMDEFTEINSHPLGERNDENHIDEIQSRMKKSKYKKHILPFEQFQVGPGINDGYNHKPKGGFHNPDHQEIMRPKTVDELRAKSNPKLTFKGRIISGKSNIDKRVKQGQVDKNRPETAFEHGEKRWNKTTQLLKNSNRLNFEAKYTNRQESKEIIGIAGSEVNKQHAPISVEESTKNNYEYQKPSNKTAKSSWTLGNNLSDYGKSGHKAYPNERDITQKRTHKSNLITAFKALTAPITDKIKTTKKENFEENSRPEGNMSSNVKNLTVYDSNDIARTTIKETTIDNDYIGQLNAPKKLTSYDPTDVAKTTIKQTTIDNKRTGDVKVNEKNTEYTYEDLPKITIRNTLDCTDNNININPDGPNKHKLFPDQEIKSTLKEITSDYEYSGNASSSNKKSSIYNTAYNSRLNINKEQISKGRKPTDSGPKSFNGKEAVNIIHKKQMSEVVNRKPCKSTEYINTPGDFGMKLSHHKDSLSTPDRIEPELLDAFRKNPFTQSLNSFSNGLPVNINESQNTNTITETVTVNTDELEKKIQEEINRL